MKIFNMLVLSIILVYSVTAGVGYFTIMLIVASLVLLIALNISKGTSSINYFDLLLLVIVLIFILYGARNNVRLSYLISTSYLMLASGLLIIYARNAKDNFNKIFIIFVILGLILGGYIFQIDIVMLLIILLLGSGSIWILNKMSEEYHFNQLKKSLFVVAKKNLLKNPNIFILVESEDRLVWANESAYEEFTELLSKRELSFLGIVKNGEFKYNNNFYENYYDNGVYFVRNITDYSRQIKKYEENAINMAYIKIDNYEFISTQLGYEKFLHFESDFKSNLFNWFIEHDIFYQEIEEDTFQIMFPALVLTEEINNRFGFLKKLVEKYQEEDISVTLSVGIALNQMNVNNTGKKANEALELAITRGGGQIVINNGEDTNYIGGRVSTIKGRTRIKAKVMGNSLLNVVKGHEVIYLITHKYPDSDALASMFLVEQLIKIKVPDVLVKIIVDDKISEEQKQKIDTIETDYHFSYVVDQTKSNLLIVLDTQSTDILSDDKILNYIKDVVVIDHHQTPVNFITNTLFSWIHPSATSTVEMISEILFAQKIKLKNRKLAELAILGIMTDTTNLKYRVDYNTLEILAYLSETGATLSSAITSQYLSQELFLIKQQALSKVRFINNYSVIEIDNISDDVILAIIVNAQMEVSDLVGALIISYVGEEAIVKFRTSSDISAKLLMEKYRGGGHHNQAATRIKKSECLELLKDLESYKGEI